MPVAVEIFECAKCQRSQTIYAIDIAVDLLTNLLLLRWVFEIIISGGVNRPFLLTVDRESVYRFDDEKNLNQYITCLANFTAQVSFKIRSVL